MNRVNRTVVILMVVLSMIFTVVGATANSWITREVDGANTVVSGCVIRFSNADGTPSIHGNSSHRCAGVKSVSINSDGWMEVKQTISGAAENPILFAFIQTDETLSGRGIIGGASGGTGKTRFRFYDTKLNRPLDLNVKSDRMRLQGKNSNAWVGWVHTTWGA